MTANRHLRLAGTRNLRDIGGYVTRDGRTTRWRMLFRSDCLDRLPSTSQAKLLALGVRTIIDIRDPDELRARPNVFAGSQQVTYRWRPLWDGPPPDGTVPDLSGGYRRELDLRGEQLADICRELLQSEALPALIHCAGGRDRTGVVVALLLALLDVPSEVIVTDYALSSTCLRTAYMEEWKNDGGHQQRSAEEFAYLWDTTPDRMAMTLEYMDQRWGGAAPFLMQHGLTGPELTQLRTHLTDGRSPFRAPASGAHRWCRR